MGRSPAPNRALRGLLAEAGWTEDLLAGRVSDLAAETGLVVWFDRRSVTHWLAGRRPRPPVPGLVAEAFSRRLGRTVTVADAGLDARNRVPAGTDGVDRPAHTGEEQPLTPAQDVVTVLIDLADSGSRRRQVLSSGVYSLGALAVPAWDGDITRPRPTPQAPVTRRLEAGQVATAEQMTRVFSDADTAFGGGHARAALAGYLAYDVAPRLHAPAGSALHRRMLSAATQLTYLCGFMCFDDGKHGLAQRYYRAALDLAVDNGDPAAYAVTLRALSVQAYALGHHRHAVQLAEAAATTGSRRIPPGRQAFLFGQVAVAAAASGDRAGAMSALGAAERRLDHATSSADSPMGGYHPAALAHQQAAVCAGLGDRVGAIAALTESIRHRPSDERRSRAITTARLAELHLDHGQLEQAVTTWHDFLDDYPFLTSGRATAAMRMLRARLRPYSGHPVVRRLLARTRNG